MKWEIILGALFIIVLIVFFVYQFQHVQNSKTTWYTSQSSSSPSFSRFFRFFPGPNPLIGNDDSGSSGVSTGTIVGAGSGAGNSGKSPYILYSGTPTTGFNNSGSPYILYSTTSSGSLSQSDIQLPSGYTLNDISPYYKKVKLSSVSSGYQVALSVSLSAQLAGNEKVNITGWEFRARRGGIFIPQAVNDYDASGASSPSDIVIGNNASVVFYSSKSPLGQNLRLNPCMGYLSHTSTFIPPLPLECPRPPRSDVENFSSQCENYVMSLYTCAFPDPNVVLPRYDDACRAYLSKLNYGGCHKRYRSDPGFFKNEWRVWTGTDFVDHAHDKILLLDTQGKIVDVYSY